MNMQAFITFITISFYFTCGIADGIDVVLDDFEKHISLNHTVYGFNNAKQSNQAEASSICNKLGGFLAHIKTQQVQDLFQEEIVTNFMNYSDDYFKDMFWIGLHQVDDNNSLWEWSDGTPLQDKTNNSYWHYDMTETNSTSEQCVALSSSNGCEMNAVSSNTSSCNETNIENVGKWADTNCSMQNNFICENPYGSGYLCKETAIFGSTPIATLPIDGMNCTVFGDNRYLAIWYRNGAVVSPNKYERIFQKIDRHTEYQTSTLRFIEPLESDKGDYHCLLHKDEVPYHNLTGTLRQLETITWMKNMSTPVISTYAIGATIELQTSLIFHADMEEYMYINLHRESGSYMEVGSPDAPKVAWGWKCSLYPDESRSYECDYVEPNHLNESDAVLVPKITFRQEEAKPIQYEEVVTFHFTITDVDTTENDIDFKFSFDEQQIFYGNEEFTGNKIFVQGCQKDCLEYTSGVEAFISPSDSSTGACGLDCRMILTNCDINERYQMSKVVTSKCRQDATWATTVSGATCPDCLKSFEVMSKPPPVATYMSGDDIELLTILKFENNPVDHLEAVWESTFNETREQFFNCSSNNGTLGCGISGDVANQFAGRTSPGYVNVIEYPKDYSFKVQLMNLTSSDNGTVIEFSLIDPQSQLVSIYTTLLKQKDGLVSKKTVVFGSTPIATLPSDSIDCTVFGENSYSAMWYRNGEVISTNTDEAIYQHFDRHTQYLTSTITFANPQASDKGTYHCMLSKDEETFNSFTAELRKLETITWVKNISTPAISTYAIGATIELQTSLIFHADMEEYMYINLHRESGSYMEVGNPDAPKVAWGWKCSLYPDESRSYECDYVEPNHLNESDAVLVPKITFRQEEAKPIQYGEIVTFHFTITGVDTTEEKIEFKFSFDEQQIFYRNEEFTGNTIFVQECPKDCHGHTSGVNVLFVHSEASPDACGLDCEMFLTNCDVNERYQKYQHGLAVGSKCQQDATWDTCPDCHKSFEVMSKPPPVTEFMDGDAIELSTILKFESNPAGHLQAVWESTLGQKKETFFNCYPESGTLGCGISPSATTFAGRISPGFMDVIEYPKSYTFSITLLKLTPSDNGTVIEFSLVDPQSQLVSIYTTKLELLPPVEETEPVTTSSNVPTTTAAVPKIEKIVKETITIEEPKQLSNKRPFFVRGVPDGTAVEEDAAVEGEEKEEVTTTTTAAAKVTTTTAAAEDKDAGSDGTSTTRPKLNFYFTLLLSFCVVALKL